MPSVFKSIQAKYILVGLSICLISIIAVSTFSYVISYNINLDLSDKWIHETTLRNSAQLDHWFDSHRTIIDSLAQDIEASGNFSSINLSKFLKSKMNTYKGKFNDFYIGFEDSKQKPVSGVGWVPPTDYDPTTRSWYQMALKSNSVIFTEPYVDAMTGELIISVAKVLRSNSKVIGVLATDITLTEVIKVVDASKINKNSYGVLLDNNGKIIAHPNPKFLPTKDGIKSVEQIDWKGYKTLVDALLANDINGRIELKDYNGEEEFFNFSRINSNGWYFGIAISKSEYRKPLRNLLFGFASAFLASMLLSLIIMVNLMKKMIKPIKALNNTVKDFSSDNMSVRMHVTSEDEIGELGNNFNKMADTIQQYSQSLEKKVEERTRELKEKNDSIMESLGYARRLQNAIIPNVSQTLGIPTENCFSIWKPRDTVGGDMFWCRGDDQHALLVVADCTGHGVPGALMSMMLNSILNATSREFGHDNPAEMLKIIDTRLKESLGQNENEFIIHDGADMALLFIDKKNKRLVFSGAKLNMFIVSKGNVQMVKGSRRSIGYSFRKDTHYENVEFPYVSDGVYYFTTDGLLDQNYEENKGGMGRRGFMSLIEGCYHLSMEEQRNIINKDINEKLYKVPQRDDITVIGLKL